MLITLYVKLKSCILLCIYPYSEWRANGASFEINYISSYKSDVNIAPNLTMSIWTRIHLYKKNVWYNILTVSMTLELAAFQM